MKVQETSRAYLQFYKNPARTWIKKQGRYIGRNYQLYILLTLIMAYYFIFAYLPIFGLRMAFMDFNPVSGFAGSKWVGFENFQRLFQGAYFWPVLAEYNFYQPLRTAGGFPFSHCICLGGQPSSAGAGEESRTNRCLCTTLYFYGCDCRDAEAVSLSFHRYCQSNAGSAGG